ncbi:hypothetical protein Dimus_026988 [Dionaea muscipula]
MASSRGINDLKPTSKACGCPTAELGRTSFSSRGNRIMPVICYKKISKLSISKLPHITHVTFDGFEVCAELEGHLDCVTGFCVGGMWADALLSSSLEISASSLFPTIS